MSERNGDAEDLDKNNDSQSGPHYLKSDLQVLLIIINSIRGSARRFRPACQLKYPQSSCEENPILLFQFTERVTGNPIHAFNLLKRFVVEWRGIEKGFVTIAFYYVFFFT